MGSLIKKIQGEFVHGNLSCSQFVTEKLEELEKNMLNSANFVLRDMALSKAAEVDEKIKRGDKLGALEGIPFGLKDVYCLQGYPASASSEFLKEYISPYTATAINKLIDAGAIPIVKENCDSFGHGSTNENSVFGPVKNALNNNNVAGGSSGGSAANVSNGHTVFSIGGDTGGSIRQPAGYNGVYGLKPTYGRISRYGLMAYASSTDCVGPISNNLEDIVSLLNIMSGKDYHDQTSYDINPVNESEVFTKIQGKEFKVGYYKNFIEHDSLYPGIKGAFTDFISKLKENQVEVKELEFFDSDLLVSVYYILVMAETASNLARLDGTNYGKRNNHDILKKGYALTRSVNFSEETKRRIVSGNQVLSFGHAEEIYLKARMLREEIIKQFHNEFNEVDLIISPVSPNTPPKIGETLKDPLAMYLSDVYTIGFSLGGLPTLTVPKFTKTGIQVSAAKNMEQLILKFAHFLKDFE